MFFLNLLGGRLMMTIAIAATLVLSWVVTYNIGWYRGWNVGIELERGKWEKERARILLEAAIAAEKMRTENKRIVAELEEAKAKVRTEYVEVVRVIREKASPVKQCFNGSVTDALNRNSVIREKVERPGTPPKTIEHRSEVEGGGTSELAAAEWVAQAQNNYGLCAAVVEGWQSWYRSMKASMKGATS